MKLSLAVRALYRWKYGQEGAINFVRDNFKVEPDAWQKKVLRLYMVNRRLAMKACKGPGKTCVLAWIAWHFLTCYEHSKIAAISITRDNLSDGLWAEMAKWQNKSPFLQSQFEWTKTSIFHKRFEATWFMSARSWSKSSSAEQQGMALAGLHDRYIMFILDESGGIPDAVMATAEAVLANDLGDGESRAVLIQAGNPTQLSGPLYRACTSERHLWAVVEITSDPANPERTPRVSAQWAQEQIDKYGKDNPWVLVNVFGKFPPSSLNTLIGADEVVEAMNREITEDQSRICRKLGIDVARFGDDSTVLFPRQGLIAYMPEQMRNARGNDVAARAMIYKMKWDQDGTYIDDTGGYGGSVIDSLIQSNYTPTAVNASGKAPDPRYKNNRSYQWFKMIEWIKKGGALPNVPELVAELSRPTYTFINGKFQLQPKEQIKTELGRSPDYADALAETFYDEDFPRYTQLEKEMGVGQSRNRVRTDFDPLKM
jgi:phage terminase large subunit